MTYATALMAFGRYNLSFSGATPAAISRAVPDPGSIASLPDLQALFGSLDSFQCADCQSVYSPAAYLVDQLQYLSGFAATTAGVTPPFPTTVTTAAKALLVRRPEIQYVALDCNNTNVTIPYIDVVNEILEAAIARRQSLGQRQSTRRALRQSRALPQQTQPAVASAAYAATATAVFPLSLPFDVNFAATTAFISALGTSYAALLNLFPNAVSAAVIAGPRWASILPCKR